MLIGNENQRLSTVELTLFTKSYEGTDIKITEENLLKSMKFKKKFTGVDATKLY